MNSLKTLIGVAVLGGIAYFGYNVLTEDGQTPEPAGIAPDWAVGPQIEMPGQGGMPGDLSSGLAPMEQTPGMPTGTQFGVEAGHDHAGHDHDHGPAAGGPAPPFAGGANTAVEAAPPYRPGGQAAADAPYNPATPSALTNPPGGSAEFGGPGATTNPLEPKMPVVTESPGSPQPEVVYPAGNPADAGQSRAVAKLNEKSDNYQQSSLDRSQSFLPTEGSGATQVGMTGFESAMDAAREQLQQGNIGDAHLSLSKLLSEPQLSPEQHQKVLELTSQVAGTVIYSSSHHFLEQPYVVQPGDTIEDIARRHHVSPQLLAKINGLEGDVQYDQKLKVVRGPFSARIDLEKQQLSVWLGDRYAGRFPVRVGDRVPPPGQLSVRQKVQPYDPSNPWGTHALDLGDGLAIHGVENLDEPANTVVPSAIRMSKQDAEDVFDILTVGSKVVIRR